MIAGLLLWAVAASDTALPDKLYAAGQFEQAAAIYSKLVQQAPRDVPLLLRLGATDYQLGLLNAPPHLSPPDSIVMGGQ